MTVPQTPWPLRNPRSTLLRNGQSLCTLRLYIAACVKLSFFTPSIHFSRIAFTITRRNTLSSIIEHIGKLENHSTFITTGLKTRNKSICINLALCFVFVFVLIRLSMVSYLLFPKQDNRWACKSVNKGVKRVGHVENFEQNWLFNLELISFTFSDR